MRKIIIIIVVYLLILVSPFIYFHFKYSGVIIEQEVCIKSYITNERYLTTEVWVNDFLGRPKSLEYWEQVVVLLKDIDSVKQSEYNQALPVYQKVKQVFKTNE